MSSLHDTQIVSIYDLMIERRRKLTSESQMKDISVGAQHGPRRKVEEEASLNSKEWKMNLQLPRKKVFRETVSSRSPESEFNCPVNSVTASHLTKKQTFMKIQPPAKKEVISKLVEKMSMVRGRPKAESQSAKLKQESGSQRKQMATLGTSRNNQKPGKSNSNLGNRRPLSPRKADRGPKEKKADRVPREKTTLVTPTKIKSTKTSRLQMRMAKQSEGSGKTVSAPTDRWRI